MNEFINRPQWMQYVELPVRTSEPVKLDRILKARMKAFIKAKNKAARNSTS